VKLTDEMNSIKEEDAGSSLAEKFFPVVGIGASAGGLEAFKQLIKTIPENSGMAYVLVQHLDPLHDSILPEIMQRITKIPVHEILDNVKVEADHIYIIPSNKLLLATDGVLKLSPRGRAHQMPIDLFFHSLAEVYQDHAIGIVLSGTGTDGTLGLAAIKAHGGITIAQELSTAAYDGMPLSAINAEVVNYVLAPENMYERFMNLVVSMKLIKPGNGLSHAHGNEDEHFKKILTLIRVRSGVDFTYYKQATVQRRILRRMAFRKIDSYDKYFSFIREDKQEQEGLYQDLLIPVTSFFRDPQSFEDLCELVLPVISENKSVTEPLRIWIAGCSTGEEAYSIAMCLHEYLGDRASIIKIQIFATDISEVSIAKARAGIYKKAEVNGISENRLQQYFTKVDDSYHVNKNVRNVCLFAHHNFLKDPPFAKVDLVVCRNVLIYMQPYLQKKAFTTFHYALNDKCFLMLGKSENIGNTSDFFSHADKGKIYIKKNIVGRRVAVSSVKKVFREISERPLRVDGRKDDFQKNVDDIIISKYSAVGVIVNDQLDIVQFRGSTGAYLEAPHGKATLNVVKMARESLAYELRAGLHKAKMSGQPYIKNGISFNHGRELISLEVIPLLNTIEPYFLILFHSDVDVFNSQKKADAETSGAIMTDVRDGRIDLLEKDLLQTREDMRSITEDQEAAYEELQSANEELLSGSEELQSLNEELETTKEEIQSTNEELIIVNQELFDRNEQLIQSRQFAEAIVSTLHEPLLILNKDVRIISANQSFYKTFSLTEEETAGKILFELQNGQWDIDGLRKNLFEIQTGKSKFLEWEVYCEFKEFGGIFLCFNAQPIDKEKHDQLILLAIDDITLRKRAQSKLEDAAMDQKKISADLEQQVMERTLSLKKSNNELERSNENLNQFAFIASHDLQEPLRKIQVFSSLLTDRFDNELSDDAKKVVKKIVSSTKRMAHLITDVLNFSTILTYEDVFIETDLNDVLQNVVADLDFLVKEKNGVVTWGNMPVIRAVPVLINQMFNNLISNSLKFSKADEAPHITISCRALPEGETKNNPALNDDIVYWELIIRDNGIGFNQHFADQIFIIFQRLNSRYSGSGIGLTLCKKIVNYHHGFIRAESNDNEGATFFVLLPMKKQN
jgi:two-component system, chemotaxis family, CheB/CheR fusion protein